MKKDVPLCINFLTKKTPYKGLGAESEEKHEPVSDIDTGVVDSLKALDPDGRLEKRTSIRDLAMSQKCQKPTSNPLIQSPRRRGRAVTAERRARAPWRP